MKIIPDFNCARLSEVQPGSIIVCEAGAYATVSICGHKNEEHGTISVYTVFSEGSGLTTKPHIGQWLCEDNRPVADFGREYTLIVDPTSVSVASHGEADLGSALCIRENEKYIRVLRDSPRMARSAFLNLNTGHSASSIDPPYVVARNWSIGFTDPAGHFKAMVEAPRNTDQE